MQEIIKSINNETLKSWNKKQFIIIHHTWSTWTDEANKKYLNKDDYISCHYIVWKDWKIYQLCDDDMIAYHCWVSEWCKLKDMNPYCLWIEVNSDWLSFTNEQKKSTKELIEYLMKKYWISKENILRHKDIAPLRKTDVSDVFWNKEYKSWTDYQNNLIKMTELETKQLNALVSLISATWIVTWSVDLKNKLAEMNKYLREEITKYS